MAKRREDAALSRKRNEVAAFDRTFRAFEGGARAVNPDVVYLSSQGFGRGVYDGFQSLVQQGYQFLPVEVLLLAALATHLAPRHPGPRAWQLPVCINWPPPRDAAARFSASCSTMSFMISCAS